MSPFIISWLPGYGTAGLGKHVLYVVSYGNLLHKLRKWNLLSCLTGSLDPFHLTWDAMRATDSGWLSLSPLASRFCAKKPVWWIRSPSSSRGLSFMLANFVSFSSAILAPSTKTTAGAEWKKRNPGNKVGTRSYVHNRRNSGYFRCDSKLVTPPKVLC